jgi:hypothetical protein
MIWGIIAQASLLVPPNEPATRWKGPAFMLKKAEDLSIASRQATLKFTKPAFR